LFSEESDLQASRVLNATLKLNIFREKQKRFFIVSPYLYSAQKIKDIFSEQYVVLKSVI